MAYYDRVYKNRLLMDVIAIRLVRAKIATHFPTTQQVQRSVENADIVYRSVCNWLYDNQIESHWGIVRTGKDLNSTFYQS